MSTKTIGHPDTEITPYPGEVPHIKLKLVTLRNEDFKNILIDFVYHTYLLHDRNLRLHEVLKSMKMRKDMLYYGNHSDNVRNGFLYTPKTVENSRAYIKGFIEIVLAAKKMGLIKNEISFKNENNSI